MFKLRSEFLKSKPSVVSAILSAGHDTQSCHRQKLPSLSYPETPKAPRELRSTVSTTAHVGNPSVSHHQTRHSQSSSPFIQSSALSSVVGIFLCQPLSSVPHFGPVSGVVTPQLQRGLTAQVTLEPTVTSGRHIHRSSEGMSVCHHHHHHHHHH